jgi:predicted GIY-YIG superfamily endonuclease
VYEVLLEDGCRYVGVTTKPVRDRFVEHVRGADFGGAEWTSAPHKPVNFFELTSTHNGDVAHDYEEKFTLQKMKQYGAVPSFLPSGIVPGGDAVVKLWGPERAAAASDLHRA